MHTDILIIGAGITGCAAARLLSKYDRRITVVDRGGDLAEGASKANSGIVHAGHDAKPGSLKALLNVRGSKMYEELTKELGVPYRRNGALVVAYDEEDRTIIQKLYDQGIKNGVEDLRIIGRDEILELEPSVNPAAVCALEAPTSAIVSPYEMVFALADHAALNGVEFIFNLEVKGIERSGEGWIAGTSGEDIEAEIIINCAGSSGAILHNDVSSGKKRIINRRGQYYLLDRPERLPFDHTMFQCPGKLGKGVLVAPTVHGNIIIGPNAEDIDDPLDTATTAEGLDRILERAKLTWPPLSTRSSITNFSGVRAHEEGGDFIIGEAAPHFYDAIGIESPGLTAAPAIAQMIEELVLENEKLTKKEEWKEAPRRSKPFNELTPGEMELAVREDPDNGNIICRCEVVTEAEIREAIKRPVGARTIDGVKRRTRAGMGRCQGGFCSPRVLEILSEELGISPLEVRKDAPGSELLTDTIAGSLKRAKGGEA